ncbi:hypothetical protein EOM09_03735 [bacterium]|nr:hypothetical protein [bacterium]
MEVAKEMSKCVSDFALSTYGIGVTGKINKKDPSNERGLDNEVFFSIYYRPEDKYYTEKLVCPIDERRNVKELIVDKILEKLNEIM